jgi:hypothetical protein
MVITKEFKQTIIEEISRDADFGYSLFRAIMKNARGEIVTTSYLDEALARISEDFTQKLEEQSVKFTQKLEEQSVKFTEMLAKQSIEFDKKLAKQSINFDEKLAKQSADFDKKLDDRLAKQSINFDEKLAKQATDFDKKLDDRLAKQTKELKDFINAKFGAIGSRWGANVEANYREFAQAIVAQWGGTVTKWKKKIKTVDEHGRKYINRYELDLVITNGKTMLIEMKLHFDLGDVEDFLNCVEQYINIETPTGIIEKAIVTFDIDIAAEEEARNAGITIIVPE